MTEHHALGIAGAARGVLQERGRIGRDGGSCKSSAGNGKIGDGRNRPQRHATGAEQVRERLCLAQRDQKARLCVLEDPGDASQVILQLRGARRRIKRHRDTTGVEGTVERREELA